ncbi:MAG: alpha/beta fold hydrolase [Promethearchaeota archaeon]
MPTLTSDDLLSYVRMLEQDSLKFRIFDYCPSDTTDATILWVHGIGGRLENWFPLLQTLIPNKKFRLIAFDLRGHGQSSIPKGKYSVPTYLEDLNGILRALEVEEPFFLVSHSITGIVAFTLAIQSPERLQGVVSISFPGKLPPIIHKWLRMLPPARLWGPLRKLAKKELIKYAISQSSDKAVAEETIKHALKTKTRPVDRSLRSLIPASKELSLKEIKCPVLLITGKDDKAVCPEDLVKQCVEEIPRVKLKIFDNASHLVHLEWPNQVSQLIQEFITELT